jgi:hypothetical protein
VQEEGREANFCTCSRYEEGNFPSKYCCVLDTLPNGTALPQPSVCLWFESRPVHTERHDRFAVGQLARFLERIDCAPPSYGLCKPGTETGNNRISVSKISGFLCSSETSALTLCKLHGVLSQNSMKRNPRYYFYLFSCGVGVNFMTVYSVYGSRNPEYGRRGSATLTTRYLSIRKKLALTSPTSGCRSVGINRSRTEATALLLMYTT